MHWRAFTVACLGLTLAVSASADIVEVYVFSFDYSTDPTRNTIVDPVIQVGDTVRWVWLDGNHDVQSVDNQAEVFSSGFPPGGQLPFSFEHTFTNEGTFWYYCTPHGFDNGDGTASGMAGTVTVEPVPEPGTLAALTVGGLALLRRRKRAR